MDSSFNQFIKDFSNINLHRKIYLIGLFILAVGLPLSPILVSNAQFILGINWLIEGNFNNKLQQIKKNKIIWFFFILPLIHLLWLANTSDFVYAVHDLKIKAPLIVFPLIIGSTAPLSSKELRWVLKAFVFGVFCGTTVSFAVITGIYPYEYNDIRDISLFISHIRFGLMILFSLIITGYFFIILPPKTLLLKISVIALTIWFFVFLIILQSITSWVCFSVLIIFILFRYFSKVKNPLVKFTISFLAFAFLASGIGLVTKVYYDFNFTKTFDINNLPEYTPYGNKYSNNKTSPYKEYGHLINILICNKELKETWPQISKIPFYGKDANGYSIRSTMIRYLTSKGLTKDKDGLLSLEPEDVLMIEKGYASCVYRKKFIPYVKIYDVVWEIDRYSKTGNANNKSIAQRIEFSKTAFHIIKQNFWFGVGTGDIGNAFKAAYVEMDSNLDAKNRLRAHNQFLTFFATFGIIGLFPVLFSLLYPAIKNWHSGGFLLHVFVLIIFMSMFNEDTLETQAGVTFYIAFYTLFIFSQKNNT